MLHEIDSLFLNLNSHQNISLEQEELTSAAVSIVVDSQKSQNKVIKKKTPAMLSVLLSFVVVCN